MDVKQSIQLTQALVADALGAMPLQDVLKKWLVQAIFLFTGVFSTCAAQFIFYQGAGDQKAMLLPLCNYLGMMLVGLIPVAQVAHSAASTTITTIATDSISIAADGDAEKQENDEEPERTSLQAAGETSIVEEVWTNDRAMSATIPVMMVESMELTRRQAAEAAPEETAIRTNTSTEHTIDADSIPATTAPTPWTLSVSASPVQVCIIISVVLDFAGCIFCNIGLSMAGSGLYQVVYSSVICWSALMSRFFLKKIVSREEWIGIALVTFGLAFSALGVSSSGRNNYMVLMGCFNTLVGAGFYGGNYVAGEYTLNLPERPQPKELCLKIGTACVAIIAIYQLVFVLPEWQELVTKPIAEANGNTFHILLALVSYTLSQLAHGLTYFMMLGSSGAVTTGIMQSLRAVCVFAISSVLYCSQQESQCFDTKRGMATLIVVSGVMFYSWAKSQAKGTPVSRKFKQKMVAGKNYVV